MQPDHGQMFIGKKLYKPSEPFEARANGIGMVFQHLSLFEALTVAENIELGINVIDESDNSYPYLLDTKAEILWKLNRKEEAIMIINTALKIDPDNEYYKNQKIKFTK